jgi:hypothetical protein
MSEPYLPMTEIEQRYPNEWVLVARPKFDRHSQVRGGHVLFHTPDRLVMDQRMYSVRDDECGGGFACFYTGERALEDAGRPDFVDVRHAQ